MSKKKPKNLTGKGIKQPCTSCKKKSATQKTNQFGLRRSGLHAIAMWAKSLGYNFGGYVTNVKLPMAKRFRSGCYYRIFENPEAEAVAKHVACHPEQVHIIQLRDPYNWLASRIKKWPHKSSGHDPYNVISAGIWVEYARRCQNDDWGGNVLIANYNEWCQSSEYRIALAAALDLETDGKPFDGVPKDGNGSSFDKRSFDGKGSQMATLPT